MLTLLEQLEAIRFFDIKLMDAEDFLTLLVRYLINFLIAFAVIQGIYRKVTDSKEFLFTFYIMNSLVFLICFIFDSAELSMGFAFGLFAIFGILRYRTTTIPAKDMTYLFMLIAIAVVNALAQKKISYAELLFANGVIIGVTALLEFTYLRIKEQSHAIEYERIDLITPNKRPEMLADLRNRTGVRYHRIEIERLDFLRDTARVKAYYFETRNKNDREITIPDVVKTLVIGGFFFLSSCDYVTVDSQTDQLKSKSYTNEKDAPKLFDDDEIHEIRIYLDQEGFWDSLLTHHETREEGQKRKYMPAALIIDNVMYDSTGIRLKGESSFDFASRKKKSIKVDIARYGKKNKHKGVRKFNLLNGFKDPTFLRDKIYSEYLRKHGVPAPRISFTRLYINDDYWGLYIIAEQIDDDFLDEWFGTDDGNLYKGYPDPKLDWPGAKTWEYKSDYRLKHKGGQEKFTDLYELLQAMNAPDNEIEDPMAYVTRLDQVMNTSDMLKTWAINSFVMNFDTYNMYYPHNFYLFHNPRSDKFEWVSYDGNYTLAPWNPEFKLFELVDLPVLWDSDAFAKPLTGKMFKNPFYKQLYLDHMYRVAVVHSSADFEKLITKYSDQIRDAVYTDSLKQYSNANFEKNLYEHIGDINEPGAFIPGLVPFMKDRYLSVKAQLNDYGYDFKRE